MSIVDRVLVIGGGLAGAAAAATLARSGCPVVLLERTSGPHDKVCGEFLSDEAVRYLHDLSIDLQALGAVPIEAVRVCAKGRIVTARLPFPALSLSRRVLDEALLQTAAANGAELLRGGRVRTLSAKNGGWVAELDDGERLDGATAFLATGKHDLRGWKRPQGIQDDLVAFKLHWRLAPEQAAAIDRHVELILFPGGYAGLEPVENGIANLCLVVRRQHFAAAGQTWPALLASLRSSSPHLDHRLSNAVACWERPLAISAIPYGYVRRDSEGLWHLGDQAAVIPSFSGDGMSIALHSARLAARCYIAGQEAATFQAQLARDVGGQVRRATSLSRAAVHPLGQIMTAAAVQLPGVMRYIAHTTRVPPSALQRVGVPT